MKKIEKVDREGRYEVQSQVVEVYFAAMWTVPGETDALSEWRMCVKMGQFTWNFFTVYSIVRREEMSKI